MENTLDLINDYKTKINEIKSLLDELYKSRININRKAMERLQIEQKKILVLEV